MAAARHDAKIKGYLPLPGHNTHKHNKGKMASETPNHVPIRRGASLPSSLSSPIKWILHIQIPVQNGILPLGWRTKQRAAQDPPNPPTDVQRAPWWPFPTPRKGNDGTRARPVAVDTLAGTCGTRGPTGRTSIARYYTYLYF